LSVEKRGAKTCVSVYLLPALEKKSLFYSPQEKRKKKKKEEVKGEREAAAT